MHHMQCAAYDEAWDMADSFWFLMHQVAVVLRCMTSDKCLGAQRKQQYWKVYGHLCACILAKGARRLLKETLK